MRLTSVTLELFRNIVAPQTLGIEHDVTGLVGKNESGKTTILKALHRLNPANGTDRDFDLTTEYPRWRLAPDRRKDPNLAANTFPVSAEFVLEEDDVAAVGTALGVVLPAGATCTARRNYLGTLQVSLSARLEDRVRAAAAETDVPPEDLEDLIGLETTEAVRAAARARARELKADADTALRGKAMTSFGTALGKLATLDTDDLDQEVVDALVDRLPKFFYFASYQALPGEVDLFKLAEKVKAHTALAPREETALALLAYAGVAPKDFLDENYDSRKAELQAASRDLSTRAFAYWKQNTDLTVVFDTDMVEVDHQPNGDPIFHRYLKIELRDARHGDVETNFSTRSSGFQWFFSFFAAFSAYQESDDSLVVLLDEPGTSLHGEAQKDFVRFMSEELGSEKPTIYTTHSQYLIDPTKYEKLRAVNDRATREDPSLGVAITAVDLSADAGTVLPVESALGYSISQHLFIGAGHHLAVEGSSDFVYLQRVTEHFLATGGSGLDPRLAIIPVGGAGNMPAFVALLGRRLKVSALIDGDRTNAKSAKVLAAAEANGVPASAVVTCSQSSDDLPVNADIEDLFSLGDYLRLYNWAFGTSHALSDLPATTEPILRRLLHVVGEFDHALPAHALTENRDAFFESVEAVTLERFAALFTRLNATLESPADAEGASGSTRVSSARPSSISG